MNVPVWVLEPATKTTVETRQKAQAEENNSAVQPWQKPTADEMGAVFSQTDPKGRWQTEEGASSGFIMLRNKQCPVNFDG